MRTTCTWDHVMAMRKTITPFLSKERVLEVYSRIPPKTRPYTCEYTAVYWKYAAQCLR